MSELRTNRIVPRDGLTSGTFGGIIQVVQTVKQTYQTNTGNSKLLSKFSSSVFNN